MATFGTSATHTCAHHCIPRMIVLKYEWKVHTSWSCYFGFLFMYIEETINNCLRTCANTISNHNVHACWLAMASSNGLNQFQKHVNAVLESPKRRFDHSLYTYIFSYNFYLKYPPQGDFPVVKMQLASLRAGPLLSKTAQYWYWCACFA